MSYPYTLAAALVLASVYVFGGRLRGGSHHRRWVSIAAGVSVATIFVDLLPEISEGQARFSADLHRDSALFPAQSIYLAAMLGFVLFYGLEYMVAASSAEDEPSGLFFSFQIAAFAAYSSLIAYLLVHSVWNGAPSLLLYALAMAFHLLLVDHSLARERRGPTQAVDGGYWPWLSWQVGPLESLRQYLNSGWPGSRGLSPEESS